MRIDRRHLLFGVAATSVLPIGRAHAASIPIPAEATAFGADIAALGPAPKHLRIALLNFQGSSFWAAADHGVVVAQEYLKALGTTVDAIDLGTKLSAEAVSSGIDGALAKQYDGIAVVPIFDGTVAKVNEAIGDGVPVVAFIADSAMASKRTVALGQQAYQAGASAGGFIIQQLGGTGKVAVITGYLGAAQHKARMDGALDLIRKTAPGIHLVGPFECKDDDATAYAQATDAMTSNPDLKLIYVTAGGSQAAAKAVHDANANGRVGVVGYDNLPEKQAFLHEGEFLALIDQSPARQTFDSAVILHNILSFKTEYPSTTAIPAAVIYGKFAKR